MLRWFWITFKYLHILGIFGGFTGHYIVESLRTEKCQSHQHG